MDWNQNTTTKSTEEPMMAVSAKNTYLKAHKSKMEEEEHRRRRNQATVELRKDRRNSKLEEARNLPSEFDLTSGLQEETIREVTSVLGALKTMVKAQDAVDSGHNSTQWKARCLQMLRSLKDSVVESTKDRFIVNNIELQHVLPKLTEDKVIQYIASDLLDALLDNDFLPSMTDLLFSSGGASEIIAEIVPLLEYVLSSSQRTQLSSFDSTQLHKAMLYILNSNDSLSAPKSGALICLANIIRKGFNRFTPSDTVDTLHTLFTYLSCTKSHEWGITIYCVRWSLKAFVENQVPTQQHHLDQDFSSKLFLTLRDCLSLSEAGVRVNAQWALIHLLDAVNSEYVPSLVASSGLLSVLHTGLKKDDMTVPWMKLVAIIALSHDDFPPELVKHQFLERAHLLLESSSSDIQMDCITCLNALIRVGVDVQMVIDAGLLPKIVNVLYFGDYKNQKESTYFLATLSAQCNAIQIQSLVNCDVINALAIQLTIRDPAVIQNALHTYDNILQKSQENIAEVKRRFDESVYKHLDNLSFHENCVISDHASRLLDTHLSDADCFG